MRALKTASALKNLFPMKDFSSVDEFIASFPDATQKLLSQMRGIIKDAAPDAEESISYMMPAYKLHGALVYFSGYKNHIGFYPGASGVANFSEDIASYKTAKGSIQFPLNEPLPDALISKIVRFRVAENIGKVAARKKKKH